MLSNLKQRLKQLLKRAISPLKNHHRHILCLAVTLAFILISAFLFQGSYVRIFEACRDFVTSVGDCFSDGIESTANEPSQVGLQDLGLLPDNLELFIIKLRLYGKSLITGTSLRYYVVELAKVLQLITYVLLLLLLIAIMLALPVYLQLKKEDNNYNQDSKPLRIVKLIADKTYRPAKRWVKGTLDFIKERKYYWIIWACIWALNFNFITVVIEVFAYYFYFLGSSDLLHLYVQAYKLLLDLSVVITFFPAWCWAIIGLAVYDLWRRLHSLKKLKKAEEDNEAYVEEMPIATLICGAMGTKKTTFATDLIITANKYFRDVALNRIIENSLKFPNFPWINLERCIKYGMERHVVYNLATCKMLVSAVRVAYERGSKYSSEFSGGFTRALKSRYGYDYGNYLFDYDEQKYGATFYDNLEVMKLFDVLETYAQLYFIYVISCSLIIANYSIRTDDILDDIGNFPIWDIDFFDHDSERMLEHSRRSHILDQDAIRLGIRMLKDNKFKDSIDFGIIGITEVGKERGNKQTSPGRKELHKGEVRGKKIITASDTEALTDNPKPTPDTDLLNINVKMCRSQATVDHFPFILWIMDEQRSASLNADFNELCDKVYIHKSSDFKFITPLFAPDELVYDLSSKLYKKFFKIDKHNKGSNTLTRHVATTLQSCIYRHYIRLYNFYSVSMLEFEVKDGKEENAGNKRKYKVSKKKIHSCRFATDVWGGYYNEKTKRSPYGIVDIPEYAGLRATFEEWDMQHSYIAEDVKLAMRTYSINSNDSN